MTNTDKAYISARMRINFPGIKHKDLDNGVVFPTLRFRVTQKNEKFYLESAARGLYFTVRSSENVVRIMDELVDEVKFWTE